MSIQLCQNCSTKFGLFKKKTKCYYCELNFCRNCIKSANRRIPSPTSSPDQFKTLSLSMCSKCMIMSAPGVSHYQLMSVELRFVKLFLTGRGIAINGYHEKGELAQLIVDYNRRLYPWTTPRDGLSNNPTFPSSYSTTNRNMPANRSQSALNLNNSPLGNEPNEPDHLSSSSSVASQPDQQESNLLTTEQPEQPTVDDESTRMSQVGNRRASLSDLDTIEAIDSLGIRDIKIILTKNFVNYKGCVEKEELKERLRTLWKSNKALEMRQQQMNNSNEEGDNRKSDGAETSGLGASSVNDNDVCKICMDRMIDCVLVECGHMCSCVKCGKLLSECPICRQYVVRVIRVFKS